MKLDFSKFNPELRNPNHPLILRSVTAKGNFYQDKMEYRSVQQKI